MDFAEYHDLVQLYADYASAVDSGDWDRWPEFFVDVCSYRLVPRENHERGFPLATLSFESKGMLRDRVYGIRETLFHDGAHPERGQLRRLPDQARRAEHGLQRRPLPRCRRAHAGRPEVRVAPRRLRQRDDPELHHLSTVTA